MDQKDWLILQILYKHKNISKTAQVLFMSQPALTARVQQIENEFNVKIAFRTSKGFQFTPEGEYLAQSADAMLDKLSEIKEEVLNINNSIIGTLRVGASNYFTTYILPSLLRLFQETHPDVDFDVVITRSTEIVKLLYNGKLHAGFVSSDVVGRNQKHLLLEDPICVASLKEIDLADLPNLPRIDYQSNQQTKTYIDNWWRETYTHLPTKMMKVDRLPTCKEMVKNGLGYSIMPSLMLNDTPYLYKYFLQDKEGKPLMRKSWITYNEKLLKLNVLRTFVEFVKSVDIKKTMQI